MKRWLAGLALLGLWTIAVRSALGSSSLVVEVEMMSETAGQMQLYADDGRGFRQALSARLPVIGSAGFETHRLDLEIDRSIRALRFDPLNVPGRLVLRSITVTFAGRSERFAGPALGAWKPAHQLEESDPGTRDRVLVSQGTDPRLVLAGERKAPGLWTRLTRPPAWEELALSLLGVPLLLLALCGEQVAGRWRHGASQHSLALTAPLGFLWALNHRVLGAWWTHDDPCLLASTLESGAAAHFWRPEVWRGLSGSVLMPWTPLSFGVDHALFGLDPRAFYGHQLLAFSVLVVLVYGLLRRFLSPFTSSAAIVFFIASAPSYAVAGQLMNRHYLEGLILTLGALALYVRAVECDRLGPAVAGAGLYLAATTAKEIFVPLAAVLPLLPVGRGRARLRRAWPFAVAAGLYAPWRLYMLGWSNSLSGYAADAAGAGGSRVTMLGLTWPWQVLLASLVLGIAAFVFVRRGRSRPDRSRLWLLAVAAAAIVLPLVPVLANLGPRHFWVPALAAAALLGAALQRLLGGIEGGEMQSWPAPRRVLAAAAGLGLAAAGLHALAQSPIWRHHPRIAEHYGVEGRFIFESDADGILLTTLGDASYLSCVDEIRRKHQGRDPGPGFCGDPCWCSENLSDAVTWAYSGDRLIAGTPPPAAACAEPRALEVEMRYDRRSDRFAWRFGPYEDGTFQVLLVSDRQGVSVPVPMAAAGDAPLALTEPFRWIVKYRSPDGWQTYSPVLALDPDGGPLQWQRAAPDG